MSIERGQSSERRELEELLARVGGGDEDAFMLLYQRTNRRVYGMVRRVLVDNHWSGDVTQEIFLLVWQHAGTYRPEVGSPIAWLMMIAHRRAVDKVRTEQAHTGRNSRWAAESSETDYDVVVETVMNRAEAAMLTECLRTLTDLQRQAINMAFYGGMTYAEVAQKLNTPPGTVKSRIRDGLRKLRFCLDAP